MGLWFWIGALKGKSFNLRLWLWLLRIDYIGARENEGKYKEKEFRK